VRTEFFFVVKIRSREVLSTNLGGSTGCPDAISSVFPGKFRDFVSVVLRLLPCIFFTIYYLLRNDREIGKYTRAVPRKLLGKHVPAATDTNATEERCFLCGP
jgi:hypothetical protein